MQKLTSLIELENSSHVVIGAPLDIFRGFQVISLFLKVVKVPYYVNAMIRTCWYPLHDVDGDLFYHNVGQIFGSSKILTVIL